MHTGLQPSWTVTTDAPKDLNYAMYVACSFTVIPEATPFIREQIWSAYRVTLEEDERQILSAQWTQWWNEIVQDKAEMQHPGRWSKHYFDEGQFVELSEPLRSRCEEAFSSFNEWWEPAAGGQQGVNYWDKAHNIQSIVRRVEDELGRKVKPFRLIVDYIYTGLGSIVDVTPSYAVMSVHRPNLSVYNDDWWLAKIRELA